MKARQVLVAIVAGLAVATPLMWRVGPQPVRAPAPAIQIAASPDTVTSANLHRAAHELLGLWARPPRPADRAELLVRHFLAHWEAAQAGTRLMGRLPQHWLAVMNGVIALRVRLQGQALPTMPLHRLTVAIMSWAKLALLLDPTLIAEPARAPINQGPIPVVHIALGGATAPSRIPVIHIALGGRPKAPGTGPTRGGAAWPLRQVIGSCRDRHGLWSTLLAALATALGGSAHPHNTSHGAWSPVVFGHHN
jgi:hypothetical protein